jgi:hypothetical protein
MRFFGGMLGKKRKVCRVPARDAGPDGLRAARFDDFVTW